MRFMNVRKELQVNYLHVRSQGSFNYFRQYSIVPINIMKADLNVVAPNLRNWQRMYQTSSPATKIHQNKKKDLHLQYNIKLINILSTG